MKSRVGCTSTLSSLDRLLCWDGFCYCWCCVFFFVVFDHSLRALDRATSHCIMNSHLWTVCSDLYAERYNMAKERKKSKTFMPNRAKYRFRYLNIMHTHIEASPRARHIKNENDLSIRCLCFCCNGLNEAEPCMDWSVCVCVRKRSYIYTSNEKRKTQKPYRKPKIFPFRGDCNFGTVKLNYFTHQMIDRTRTHKRTVQLTHSAEQSVHSITTATGTHSLHCHSICSQ